MVMTTTDTVTVLDAATDSADDLDDLRRQLDVTRLIVQKLLLPSIVLFGVSGNLVNVAVLTRRSMKSSTNSYLTALAVYDILYLVFALTMTLNHYASVTGSAPYQHYRKPVGRPLTDTASNTGIWLTLTFTVERYIAVCHPMKGKVLCTPRRARVIVVVVSVAAACATLPEFFECRVQPVPVKVDAAASNDTRLSCVPTTFGNSTAYSFGYRYANQALFTFIPLLLLAIFNALLIHAVLNAARQRQLIAKTGSQCRTALPSAAAAAGGGSGGGSHHEQHRHGQQRITVMLIIVVIVFLLCQLPQAIQHLYIVYLQVTHSFDQRKIYLLKITGNVFNLLVVINCSVNFVLYSSFSSKFRMTFRRLFCLRLCPCGGAGRGDSAELRRLREDAADEVELTTTAVGGSSTSPALRGPRRHRRDETVIVVATPDGSRTFITRQRSRDRKQRAPTTAAMELTVTQQHGLTTTSLLTSGSSQSSLSDTSTPLVHCSTDQCRT